LFSMSDSATIAKKAADDDCDKTKDDDDDDDDLDMSNLYEIFSKTQELLALQTVPETPIPATIKEVDDEEDEENDDLPNTANATIILCLEQEEKEEAEAEYYSSLFQMYDGNWPVDGRPDLTGEGLKIIQNKVQDDRADEGEAQDFHHADADGNGGDHDEEGGFFYLEDYFPLQEKYNDMFQLLKCRNLAMASILLRRMKADIAPPYVRIRWLKEWERKKILECKKKANEARLFRQYEKALKLYEGALVYFPARMFVAPEPDINEMVGILSSQAECYLQLDDYQNAGQLATYALLFDGQHVRSRVRRAKAELALARIHEEHAAEYLVQAKVDLETVAVESSSSDTTKSYKSRSSSKYLEDSPEKLLQEVVIPLLERERRIYYDGFPGGNWELHMKVLEARCWGELYYDRQ